MWARYLELAQRDEVTQTDDTSLEQLRTAAAGYLRRGIDASRNTRRVSDATAVAAIYLAQSLLTGGDAKGAIALLEDAQFGPLTLLSRGDPAAERPEFAVQAYETALRAYVAAEPPQEAKIARTVEALEKAVQSAGGGNADQLTRVYVGLGVQLDREIDALREAGKTDQAARVAAAFTALLDRLAARAEGAGWGIRQWVAQSYFNLGASEKGGSSARSREARQYLTQARDLYQRLLESAGKANPPPTETGLLAAKFQLGECYRELGEFERALDTYSEVLREKESSLAVQRGAALAYQQRGGAEGAEWYERAIHGGYQVRATGENRIWGWLKLAQVAGRAARSEAKYRDAFFEARFNMARCRYLYAMQQEAAGRQQNLAQAKLSIHSVARLYPELGGPKWKGEFDALLKQIQTAAGEQAVGLQEFAAK
jgi:tetratricopeptide (TPR) repeat protein